MLNFTILLLYMRVYVCICNCRFIFLFLFICNIWVFHFMLFYIYWRIGFYWSILFLMVWINSWTSLTEEILLRIFLQKKICLAPLLMNNGRSLVEIKLNLRKFYFCELLITKLYICLQFPNHLPIANQYLAIVNK